MRLATFLLGVIATSSITASIFFFKFWKRSRDPLFLSFGVAFLIEGMNRTVSLFAARLNEASPWMYIVRLTAFLIILGAILRKNYGTGK